MKYYTISSLAAFTLLWAVACNPFESHGEKDLNLIIELREAFKANPDDEEILEKIVQRTYHPDTLSRTNAVAVLGQLSHERTYGPQIKPIVLPVFIHHLDDSEQSVKKVALQGLSNLGTHAEPALPAIRRKLSDPDEFIQKFAERTLTEIEERINQQPNQAR
jgi:HEAT repeat protein